MREMASPLTPSLVAMIAAISVLSLKAPGLCVEKDTPIPISPNERSLIAQFPNSSPLENQNTPAPEFLNRGSNSINVPLSSESVQIQNTQPITLQQALDLGRRNNPPLEAGKLFLERQQAVVDEAQAGKYPTITFGTDFTRRDFLSSP
jgi:OMF family outer membrane factor